MVNFNVWMASPLKGGCLLSGIVNTAKKKQGTGTHGVEDILLGFGFRFGRRDPRTRVRFPLGPSERSKAGTTDTREGSLENASLAGALPVSHRGIRRADAPFTVKKDQEILIFGVPTAPWITNWVVPMSSPASSA